MSEISQTLLEDYGDIGKCSAPRCPHHSGFYVDADRPQFTCPICRAIKERRNRKE